MVLVDITPFLTPLAKTGKFGLISTIWQRQEDRLSLKCPYITTVSNVGKTPLTPPEPLTPLTLPTPPTFNKYYYILK